MDNIADNDQSGSDLESSVPVSLVNSSQLQLGTQASVIQSVGGHIIQVGSAGDAGAVLSQQGDGVENKKRHDLLARRPSYRKIFNELSDTPNAMPVTKIEEESDSGDSDINTTSDSASGNTGSVTSIQYPAQAGQGTIQIATHGDAAAQGIQTLTMTNINSTPQPANSGATIVQYAQGPDGQFFIPVSTISAGNISYQMGIAPATSLGQNVVMATAGSGVTTAGGTEEASRKRELRLLKNREAARECRRKKKEYIKCLENRVALLENQNKTLIEELKSLKELYCQKDTQS